MGGLVLKVKTSRGQYVVNMSSTDETIGTLKSKIAEVTSIPADGLNVLIGFPPKPIDLSVNENTISSTGIKNGDSLIVEEKPLPDVVAAATCHQVKDDSLLAQRLAAEEKVDEGQSEGILLKQVVPSDNSCLFTSIGKLRQHFRNNQIRNIVNLKHCVAAAINIIIHETVCALHMWKLNQFLCKRSILRVCNEWKG